MSNMSFLEKLLDGAKVEWKRFGDVSKKITSGGTPQTGVPEYWEGGTIPWMSSGEVNLETVYRTENFITDIGLKNSSAKVVPKNSLVIALAGQGKTRGKVARIRIDLTTNQSLASITVKEDVVNSDYLYHFLKTQYENLRQISSGSGTRGGLNLQIISNYKFPLPCPENPKKSLEIQAEIVRILETFTELTTELTAELGKRKKQFHYYRNQVLSFKEGEVEWKMLGELAENLDSKRKPITSGLRDAGEIPYYGASGIVDYVKDYIFDGDFLLVSEDGANLLARNTPIAFSISGKTWVNNHAHVLKFDTYAERRYVEYYLNSIDLTPYISGAAQPKLNKKNLESISIPNPSLEEKERIVATLDKFDALTNSSIEGLPREIELRQKQYEFYRDLLLSFPTLDSEVMV